MADSKISGLPTTTSLGGDELVPIVDDPGTTPTNKAVTVTNLLAAGIGTYQPLQSDLTDLVARWVAASAAGPASLDFAEDTDNGSNIARVIAPASMAADRTVTLPDATGTLITQAQADAAYAVLTDPLGIGFAANAPSSAGTSQSTIPAANRATWKRNVGAGSTASVKIYVAVSSGNVDLGVYTKTGAGTATKPNTRVTSSGSVACPASGVATFSLTGAPSVTHGSHFFGFSCDNTTASFVVIGGTNQVQPDDGNSWYAVAAFPLADPAPAVAALIPRLPYMVCG